MCSAQFCDYGCCCPAVMLVIVTRSVLNMMCIMQILSNKSKGDKEQIMNQSKAKQIKKNGGEAEKKPQQIHRAFYNSQF